MPQKPTKTPKPKIGDVKDALRIDQINIKSLDTAGMRRFLQGYNNARVMARKRLQDALDRLGEGSFSAEHSRAVLYQIEAAIKQMEAGILAGTGQAVSDASALGLKSVAAQLGGMQKIYSGVTTPLAINQAKVFWGLQQGVAQSRMRMYQASIKRYGMPLIQRYEQFLGEAITAKLPISEVRDNLIKQFNARTADEIPRLAGTTTDVRPLLPWQAQRIVRTEYMASYNGAKWAGLRHERDTDFPDMKKKILAILDDRTEADSLGVHGQIREVDEEFTDGAGRSYLYPPARPNDRETVLPWRDEWGNNGAEDDIDDALPEKPKHKIKHAPEPPQETKQESTSTRQPIQPRVEPQMQP